MMNKFQEYMETADLYKRMTPEDVREIQKHKNEIVHLKRSGDDSVIQQEIRYEYGRIRQIEDKYRSDEEKKKRKDAKDVATGKAMKKNADARQVKSNAALEKYNKLSDVEKAKEAIVGVRNRRFMKAKERNVIIEEILKAFEIKERPYQIKSQFNLSEKTNLTHADMNSEGVKAPEKLKEIFKKYDMYSIL